MTSLTNAAVNRMQIDLQNAIPNSVRVDRDTSGSDIVTLELLLTADGGRYRYADDSDKSETDALSPGYLDDQFHILSGLSSLTTIPTTHRMVVNPFNTAVLYSGASGAGTVGVITPDSTTLTLTKNAATNEDRIVFSTDIQFDILGNGSPRKRFYITNTPVKYRCSEATGELIRYTNYAVASAVSTGVPASSDAALVLNNITDCDFLYNPGGISQRLGMVSIHLQITDPDQDNESVNLVKQVRVFNAP